MVSVSEDVDPAIFLRPARWTEMSMEEVAALRTLLFRGGASVSVKYPQYHISLSHISPGKERVVEAAREIAMSIKPVDAELRLEREVKKTSPDLDIFLGPMGPRGDAVSARVVDNPVVPRAVDMLVDDTDARAEEGVWELYSRGIDPGHIQLLFSTGLLGLKRQRKLVPTRWTITAVQDILARKLAERVKNLPEWDRPTVYSHTLFGNRFHVLYVPGVWSFEMEETWLKGAFWGSSPEPFSDYEFHTGRRDYASKVTGAYYAARLSVLEHLIRNRRQASVVIYREITSEYWAPLGVWVIREGVREALRKGGVGFETLTQAIVYITRRVDVKDWAKHSVLLKHITSQRRIDGAWKSEKAREGER